MSLSQRLAPLQVPRHALAEAVVLPLLFIALGLWTHPADPLHAWSGFPWPVLAPVLIALRHGPMPGVFSAITLLAAWLGLQATGHLEGGVPRTYFLGTLVITLVAGEFASLWRNRLRRAEAQSGYQQERLERLTREHYLLRLSHDRLEQDLLSRPASLRDALATLRAEASASAPGADPLPGADALLKLLAQFCQIESAALVALAADGRPATEAACRIGHHFPIVADDPLVRASAGADGLCHVAGDIHPEVHGSQYLVAARLRDLAGADHGLLIVESMPFLAMHEESLQILNLMVGYYADALGAAALVAPITTSLPACPPPFALELQRLWHMRRDSGLPAALVALTYPHRPLLEDMPLQWPRLQRAMDTLWHVRQDEREAILVLMPMTGPAAIEGYLSRMEAWLGQHLGDAPGQFGIALHAHPMDHQPAAQWLAGLLDACHVAPDRPVRSPA
jgi:hypothetical protein